MKNVFSLKTAQYFVVVALSVFFFILFLTPQQAFGNYSITEFNPPTSDMGPTSITSGPDGNLWFSEVKDKIGRVTPDGIITEFSLPTTNNWPDSITSGPDGNLWFTEFYTNKIARITTSGIITEFSLPTANSGPTNITSGPDGNLWYTDNNINIVGKITPDGVVTEFSIPNGADFITSGSDGNLWFTESSGLNVGRITTSGAITEFQIPDGKRVGLGITSGPDGNLWFIDDNTSEVGRITTNGVVTEFKLPITGTIDDPYAITSGPDGNLWFTEGQGNKIGRITTSGVITEVPVPTNNSVPAGITFGSDGNIWFTESSATKIGRVNLSGPRQVEFVHGINTSFLAVQNGTAGFQSLKNAIPSSNFHVFPYYQDIGYQLSGGGCGVNGNGGVSPQPTPDTNTGPLQASGGIDSSICDSQSALAYNATGLDDELAKYTSPVSVIGYSMGGAITRGWLTLAQNRQNDTTLNNVDNVITIQAAHEGSYLALGGLQISNALSWTGPLWTTITNSLQQKTGLDISRPAEQDLTPVSAWYQSVNPTNLPANIHYYNFYSDIQVSAHPQVFFVSLPAMASVSFGDDVMLPGDPNPNALPAFGGARFLPNGGHEYRVASNHDVLLGNSILDWLLGNPLSLNGVAGDVVNDDIMHLNLNQHLTDTNHEITSCSSSIGQTTIQDEILRILANPAQACN